MQKSAEAVENKNTRRPKPPGKHPEQKDPIPLSMGQSLRLFD
ncbi:hypothetical protein SX4_0391 [Vibrio mimicus SX-4]|nr:hypothetical protein VII_001717 [Vibrio mimicus MB451]EGU21061.1 hypothetical protein SX4_0391 [Vibrio mimicus SX-4]